MVVRKEPAPSLPQATAARPHKQFLLHSMVGLQWWVGRPNLHPANCNGMLHAHARTLCSSELPLKAPLQQWPLLDLIDDAKSQLKSERRISAHPQHIIAMCVMLNDGQRKPGGYSYKVCTSPSMGKQDATGITAWLSKAKTTQHVKLCG